MDVGNGYKLGQLEPKQRPASADDLNRHTRPCLPVPFIRAG